MDSEEANRVFCVDYAKQGRAACKKCKAKLDKGELRLGRIVPSPFSEGSTMKSWHHLDCLFDVLSRARATTKKIETEDDIEDFDDLTDEDKNRVRQKIRELSQLSTSGQSKTSGASPKKPPPPKATAGGPRDSSIASGRVPPRASTSTASVTSTASTAVSGFNTFRRFRKICAEIAAEGSYNNKTAILGRFFTSGSKKEFPGDLFLWIRFLLPALDTRVYNLQSKQLIKLFSRLTGSSSDAMQEDLEKGDIAETIRVFFEAAGDSPTSAIKPIPKSSLMMEEVEVFLDNLSKCSREDDQMDLIRRIANRCTGNDLRMVVRLIVHDLRIMAGPKHVLEALDEKAYASFQACRDLRAVVAQFGAHLDFSSRGALVVSPGAVAMTSRLMTPVQPMLAEACKSIEFAFKRCPNGFYSEIKYDGERVQLHKRGHEFSYFSRSLKPVMPHKVNHFKNYIPQAFPGAEDLILDAEVLLIDTRTKKPLPFGSLGVHKKEEFQDATVCLFVFDVLYYSGQVMMKRPLRERREQLHASMTEVTNRVHFSEMKHIRTKDELKDMISDVINEGLEGLVLKDPESHYEPGKRHWLKVKKDYLGEGAMADSADLTVLGAWYGTGNKGGMMSIFLMGVHDPKRDIWLTVTKVGNGHDDKTLERLQSELSPLMTKISRDPSKVPTWFRCPAQLTPDFVITDPKTAPVWEIVAAEFTKTELHTSDGISMRFPRVTKIRRDKDWTSATNFQELKTLYEKSHETACEHVQRVLQTAGGSTFKNITPTKKATPSKRRSDSSSPDAPPTASSQKRRRLDPVSSATRDAPVDEPRSSNRPKIDISPLSDVFTGLSFYLEDSLPASDVQRLRRYLVAFNGQLEQDKRSATHTVVKVASKDSPQEVSMSWVWRSIRQKRLVRQC